jgi:hypothetical protein
MARNIFEFKRAKRTSGMTPVANNLIRLGKEKKHIQTKKERWLVIKPSESDLMLIR